MNAKYIIVISHELEVPIVFSKILQHNEVAGGRKVVGAGFCHLSIDINDKRCWSVSGHSISLGIKSRPEDAEILNERLETEF